MGFETSEPVKAPLELEEERKEREKQRIRDQVQVKRGEALILRREVDEINLGAGDEVYKENKRITSERQASALESEADRLEMTIRDVK